MPFSVPELDSQWDRSSDDSIYSGGVSASIATQHGRADTDIQSSLKRCGPHTRKIGIVSAAERGALSPCTEKGSSASYRAKKQHACTRAFPAWYYRRS